MKKQVKFISATKPKFNIILLLVIIFVGIMMRLAFIPYGELWFDEIHSIFIAKLSLQEIPDYLSNGTNAPLFYFLLSFWIKWFGNTDFILRLLPIIFGTLSIVAIYFLGKIISGKRLGLIAALFMALSPFQIHYSIEVRMYSLVMFLSLLSIYFFLKGLKEKKSCYWFFYSFFTLLGLYTHSTLGLLVLIENFYILFLYFKKQEEINLRKWFFIQVLIFIGYLPWVFIALRQIIFGFLSVQSYSRFSYSSNIVEKILLGYLWFDSGKTTEWFFSVLALVPMFLNCFGSFTQEKGKLIVKKRKGLNERIFLLFILFIPVLFYALMFNADCSIRHIVFASSALYLILSKGILNIRSKKILFGILITASILMLNYNFDILETEKLLSKNTEMANYILARERPNDIIIILPSWWRHEFLYYYRGILPVKGFSPGLANQDQNSLEFAKKEIAHCSIRQGCMVVTSNNVSNIQDYIASYKRVWLLQLSLPVDSTQQTWQYLVDNWYLKHAEFFPKGFTGIQAPTVSLFENPLYFSEQ